MTATRTAATTRSVLPALLQGTSFGGDFERMIAAFAGAAKDEGLFINVTLNVTFDGRDDDGNDDEPAGDDGVDDGSDSGSLSADDAASAAGLHD